jgi:acylphosphatase
VSRSAVRLVIEGHVQGVGFRWWMTDQATRLGVSGWVRNRRDGAVEALVIGRTEDIEKLEQTCRQGPLGSRVESVTREPAEDDASRGFDQKPTL